jgi:hypothetical protein
MDRQKKDAANIQDKGYGQTYRNMKPRDELN